MSVHRDQFSWLTGNLLSSFRKVFQWGTSRSMSAMNRALCVGSTRCAISWATTYSRNSRGLRGVFRMFPVAAARGRQLEVKYPLCHNIPTSPAQSEKKRAAGDPSLRPYDTRSENRASRGENVQ